MSQLSRHDEEGGSAATRGKRDRWSGLELAGKYSTFGAKGEIIRPLAYQLSVRVILMVSLCLCIVLITPIDLGVSLPSSVFPSFTHPWSLIGLYTMHCEGFYYFYGFSSLDGTFVGT